MARYRIHIRHFNIRRSLLYACLASLGLILSLWIAPGMASPPTAQMDNSPVVVTQVAEPGDRLSQSRQLYEQGRYADAAARLEAAVQEYQASGDNVNLAIALSNLALVDQHLGRWDKANQAITQSLSILDSPAGAGQATVLAQALDVQGRLLMTQGQTEQALDVWKRSEAIYQDLDNTLGATQSRINQAEALQALGLYRRAVESLNTIVQSLQDQPPSLVKVVALRSLGDALRVSGEFTRALEVQQQSLALIDQLPLSANQRDEAIASTRLSLGNTFYAQQNVADAIAQYQSITSGSLITQTQAQLNLFRVLVETEQGSEAETLISAISTKLDRLSLSRASIYAQVNFAQSLVTLSSTASGATPTRSLAARLLSEAIQQAKELQDSRAESFALGVLGKLYEQTQQWSAAQEITQQALVLAQQVNASDIAYLWQWQLGRILTANDQREKAIAAYDGAVTTLQSLRSDLVAINQDVQFSFRDSIEPIHRQLVSLLLTPGVDPSQTDLEKARKTIESLQLAELDNFFREACLNARQVEIDEIDRRAVVLYPIVLDDRLEVVISLPPTPGSDDTEQSQDLLRHYTTQLPRADVERVVSDARRFLEQLTANSRVLERSQEMYRWLIQPVEAELAEREVKTLVFVPDGVFRNIPMAILHDGQQYLIQKYSIALTPSLQLLESKPLQPQELSVLMGGLTESRQGLPALPNVASEFAQIRSEVPNRVLLNQDFNNSELQEAINRLPFPVVHLATHGEFSSQLDQTYILTWDSRININQLSSILQATDVGRRRPIELLVLSACQTAKGDNRAALGLAGVAVRAGARSTVATLWSVNDESMSILMGKFYEELKDPGITKAEALRQAQLTLLTDPNYERPYFWSPVVLVGNWL